ncbi:hypothetical protein ACHAWU_001102 [Discostella pseudostelligera]|uniref:NADH dehydrogenase [ubiquinone] 1 beta subcomplex subunit 11, mitochondrial n=1 Tax=Discostella pseudostelligera TaxID=259834 RepID=A0ABD3MFR0_9STRA
MSSYAALLVRRGGACATTTTLRGIRSSSLPVAARPSSKSTPTTSTSTARVPRRYMGGGGGDHHHQPISRSMEAELWQGHPKEPEGWETTIYLTYGATVVLLTMALGFAPDTSIKTWASSEARARLALQAEGKLDQPVFGVHYDTPENKYEFESKSPDNPFDEDEDDDDDDEEEDEEEGDDEDDE